MCLSTLEPNGSVCFSSSCSRFMNTLFNEIHPTAGPKKPQLQLYPCVTHKLSAATQTPLGIALATAAVRPAPTFGMRILSSPTARKNRKSAKV